MAVDTVLGFNDIADLRYNPFTDTWTPREIGTVDPVEIRTVPASAPYHIKLFEYPQENGPSTTSIVPNGGGAALVEVSKTTTPASGQYRVNYDPLGVGIVEFNAAQAGIQYDISYYGLGTITQKTSLDSRAAFEQICPVGGIIGIHPETTLAKAIDLNFFAACDNSGGNITLTYQDGSTQVIARPDLSDDRFLMGDNVTTANSSGSNTHNHIWNKEDTSGGSGHTNDKIQTTSAATTYQNYGYDSSGVAKSWPTSYLNDDFYTGNADSKPQHFSVLYYIRIK